MEKEVVRFGFCWSTFIKNKSGTDAWNSPSSIIYSNTIQLHKTLDVAFVDL
jgi:hypothetical protein